MMGKNSRQLKMLFIDIDDLVPENHLLKQIDKLVDAEPSTPPAEDKQPESIEERLNDLLQQTSYRASVPYKIEFLTNTENNTPSPKYKAGQQMKLNVTVCLIMYNEPSFENSFLNKTESDADAIL